jgi:hypothetical protein
MRSFVDQIGAPVLTVRSSCTQNRSELDVKVARFIGTPGSSPAPQAWTLPVALKGADGQTKYELIDRPERTLKVDGCGATFANADSRGYYLTDYTADTVGQFAKNPARLTAAERISLLGDEWRMVRAGRHDIDLYLDLAAAMAGDDTPVITETIAERLESIGDDIADATERARYQAWIRAHFGPVLTELGLPGPVNDGDDRQYRRGILLHLVGVVGNDPAVQATARELALRYIADPNSVPSTLAPKVLQVAAVGGDAALYQRYLDQMKTAGAQPERYYRYFNALSWFSDPSLVKRTLELAVSTDVRSQGREHGPRIAAGASVVERSGVGVHERTLAGLLKTLNMFQAIPDLVGSFGAFCSVSRANDVKAFLARTRCRRRRVRRSRPSSRSTAALRSTCGSRRPFAVLARSCCVSVNARVETRALQSYWGNVVGWVS